MHFLLVPFPSLLSALLPAEVGWEPSAQTRNSPQRTERLVIPSVPPGNTHTTATSASALASSTPARPADSPSSHRPTAATAERAGCSVPRQFLRPRPLVAGVLPVSTNAARRAVTPPTTHPLSPPASAATVVDTMVNQRPSSDPGSALNGIIIGLLSSFGSAVLIAFVFLIIYFFRYTSSGRIFLDRIGRPGEYDDEQAFAREEAEALEAMDDMQRTEYLRAKGMPSVAKSRRHRSQELVLTRAPSFSIYRGEPSRICSDGHLAVPVSRHTREGRVRVGVRARVGDRQLLCRGPDPNRVLRLGVYGHEQPARPQAKRGLLLGGQNLREAGVVPN